VLDAVEAADDFVCANAERLIVSTTGIAAPIPAALTSNLRFAPDAPWGVGVPSEACSVR
jgi:hypothetical protein